MPVEQADNTRVIIPLIKLLSKPEDVVLIT